MPEKRSQFTFYRSYWEALKGMRKRDRLAILEAVIGYALDGEAAEELSSLQLAMFALIRPTLDSGRRKAKYGKLGMDAKGKLSGADSDAEPASQPAKLSCNSEKEREKENEAEIKKEVEKETECESIEGDFAGFWQAYPVKIGEDEARAAWKKVRDQSQAVLSGLEKWKNSEQWRKEGGRYIPRGAKFLLSGYWKEAPWQADAGTGRRDLDADEQAAIRRMMEEDCDAGTS